ncbi:MAG: citramalate synthase [Rickettsiales bacterium]
MTDDKIYLYDTTLRDGAQTSGVDFTVADKREIAAMLDRLGVDYIEAGWPGANPRDDETFGALPHAENAKFCAFGMTRRRDKTAESDEGLQKLLAFDTPCACIVGKAWDFQVREALGVTEEENLAMIADSVAYLVKNGRETLFDAEHFFDGHKANPDYAMRCAKAAYDAGARWVALCDTNGGALPEEIFRVVASVIENGVPGSHVGVHCHNDGELAVANSLAAVRAGARQVQGTLNGLGERCGNANLTSIIPALTIKMGLRTNITPERMQSLTLVSRALDDRLNRPYNRYAPYVGASAFAHKGGLHVSAVMKNPTCYEHIPPETVGNKRDVLVSDQAGRANVISRLEKIGLGGREHSPDAVSALVARIKKEESRGYAFDAADASFYLLALEELHARRKFFELLIMRCTVERRRENNDKILSYAEATTKIRVGNDESFTVAGGNGPVKALDGALKKALCGFYPALRDVHLTDYKVRILNPGAGAGARTRVLIESADADGRRWTTVGVSSNVINASYYALRDSFAYYLEVTTP